MADELTKKDDTQSALVEVLAKLSNKVDALGARALGVDPRTFQTQEWMKPGRFVHIRISRDSTQMGQIISEGIEGMVLVGMIHQGQEYKTVILCPTHILSPT